CALILLQNDPSISLSLSQLLKTKNLADANASEEDKIKAMMFQSNYYSKKVGPPPPHYICYRCGKPGHYIDDCPVQMDENGERPKPIRICKGIPKSFMVKAEPGTMGAMLTSSGEYVTTAVDSEAYRRGKKELPPFAPREPSPVKAPPKPIPDELLCPICKELMADAVVTPCCGNNYCDECIRSSLLDSEEHICFTCRQSDVSPDDLSANEALRQVSGSHMLTLLTGLVRFL
uniref:RBBP6 ligase n=1 Tax=Myripristis murdjan TaxID=586833 RepID=A0A668A9P2_9TELE